MILPQGFQLNMTENLQKKTMRDLINVLFSNKSRLVLNDISLMQLLIDLIDVVSVKIASNKSKSLNFISIINNIC